MFNLFGTRITKKLNTINLDDDLGDVELLEALEKIFGIKIEDHEAENLINAGQLYDLITSKVGENEDFDPVWALIVQILREHSGSRDGIDRETTFFPKDAEERTEN